MSNLSFSNCSDELFYDVVRISKPSKVSQPRTSAQLMFECTYTFRESTVDENHVEFIFSAPKVYCVNLNFQHADEIENEKENIRAQLSSWGGFRDNDLETLVPYAVQQTEKYASYFARFGYNNFGLDFEFILEHSHDVAHVSDEILLRSSFEESVANMVPATNESIKSLKRKRAVDQPIKKRLRRKTEENVDESCMICLEELFSEGYDVVSMPCKHEFHGECIEEWLGVSHKCPTCRFEMPTK